MNRFICYRVFTRFLGMTLLAMAGISSAQAQMSVEQLTGHRGADLAKEFPGIANAIDIFEAATSLQGEARLVDFRRAQQQLREAKAAHDELPPVGTMWAMLLFSAKEENAGRIQLEETIITEPEDAGTYVLLGHIAYIENRWTEARLAFSVAEKLIAAMVANHPRRLDLQIRAESGLAAVAEARMKERLRAGDAKRAGSFATVAQTHLASWIQSDPKNATAHQRMGEILLTLQQEAEAAKALAQAYELNPQLAAPGVVMARFYAARGNDEKAATQMKQAATQMPAVLSVRTAAADWALTRGDLDAAREHIDAALKIDSRSLEACLMDAQLHRYRGDNKSAVARLETLFSEHPANFAATNLLARCLAESEGAAARARAVELATVNAQRFDDGQSAVGREAGLTLAFALLQSGRKVDAGRQLANLVNAGLLSASGGVNGDSAYLVARILADRGRRDLAISILRPALRKSTAFPYREQSDKLLAELLR